MARKPSVDGFPSRPALIEATYRALVECSGSATNQEIEDKVIRNEKLPNTVVDLMHTDNRQTKLEYELRWARTYLKGAGIINNANRGVWVISPDYADKETVSGTDVVSMFRDKTSEVNNGGEKKAGKNNYPKDTEEHGEKEERDPEQWREQLANVLQNMDPYGFERLSQRVLRECGFTQVEVTKKSGDGGIDGTGKLRINGIFSFNVAFQCKRYKGLVGAAEIRDFRGSLTTNIEKGVLITTGTFSKAAREEASSPGKQQIDLIDGEEFISKIAEYGIGVRPVITYEVDEDYFKKI